MIRPPAPRRARRGWGVSDRLTLGLVGLLLSTVLCAAVAIYTLDSMVTGLDRLMGGKFNQVVAAEHLAKHAQVAAGITARLQAVGDEFELDNVAGQIVDLFSLLDRSLAELRDSGIAPAVFLEMTGQRDRLRSQVEELFQVVRLRAIADGPAPGLQQRLQGATFATNLRANQLVYSVSNLAVELRKVAEEERAERRRDLARASLQLALTAAAAAVMALILVLYLRRSVLHRLTGLRDSVLCNAAGSPAAIPDSGDDEIGDLAGAMRHFIDEIHHREGELRQLHSAVENSTAAIIITDREGRITYANPAFTTMTGYERDDVLGRTPSILRSGETPDEVYRDLWQHLLSGQRWSGTLLNRRRDGAVYWEHMEAAPILAEDGLVSHFVAVKDDITARKTMEDELRRMAVTDALTGLASRRHFLECCDGELARCRRHGHTACLLMLDLDHFKRINDGWGHGVGDATLRSFATITREVFRDVDVVGRLGGEEFAVLVPETILDGAAVAAERLRAAVQARPVILGDGRAIPFTVSIGVTAMTGADATADQVLSRADLALYEAKRSGRNRVCCDGLAPVRLSCPVATDSIPGTP